MIKHVPVLAEEIYKNLPDNFQTYFDGTLWHWWHVEYMLNVLSNYKNDLTIIGVDRDWKILEKTKWILKSDKNKIYFINDSYSNIYDILDKCWVWKVDLFLLDLGVNMEHFKDWTRWFSIKSDAELDMRFDQKQQFTAKNLINSYSKDKIIKMLIEYWDFGTWLWWVIADEIIKYRKLKEIQTTFELKNILQKIKLWENKIAVIFQCIRIEVNNELEELKVFLSRFDWFLNKWWRCMILTYHSIEDRIVKDWFKRLVETWKFILINKHVIKPTYQESCKNKAARSAKLRIIQYL